VFMRRVDRDIESTVRDAIIVSPAGATLSLEPSEARKFLDLVKNAIGTMNDHTSPPVILTALDVRRFLRRFLTEHGIDCPVLSHKEIARQYQVQPLAVLSFE